MQDCLNCCVAYQLSAVEEVSLTANQPVAQMKANRKRWNTIEADGSVVLGAETKPIIPDPVSLDAPMITLTPLQVMCCLCGLDSVWL